MSAKEYDLCIVGAGIAGAMLATQAVKNGRTVVWIEAGKRFDFGNRLAQLKKYQTVGGLMWPWQHEGRDAYVDSSMSSIGVPYPLEHHRVKAVGGTTLHWGGLAERLRPSDFRCASTYGIGVDWPLSYDELEPFYSQAEWEVGVSGTPQPTDPPRSRELPMPGFPRSMDEKFWEPIAARLGIALYTSSFAINTQPYGGRSQCLAYAACHVCPSGARYSADFHVRIAEASGLCDLLTETVARRIVMSPSGTVTSIHATTLAGKDLEIRAKDYVIAAHAVESARLLLLSKCGNESDQVGRNFMEHIYVGAGGYLKEERFHPYRIGFDRLESVHFYEGPGRGEHGAMKLEFSFEKDPFGDTQTRNLWGRALKQYDVENFGHWLGMEVETEHQPNPDSRVSLSPEGKDLFGDPIPHVRLAFSDVDRRTHAKAREIIATLLKAAGVQEYESTWLDFASHHMGTCRMSDDPKKGVVDRNCKIHSANNLYAVGSSVFPTVGAMQPTLTVAAMSLRLAHHLLSKGS